MPTLLIAAGAGVAFLIAYHTYGRWLGGRIFRLSAEFVCPSHRLRDDADYVPTSKPVVFGHHFTSIAGTGPIVGPAIAVMWGWLPALLWVLLGSIFIGAVHDFGSLVVSIRNNGQTVGDIAGRLLNRRVRLLFLCVLFLALTIVLAIFGLVIAAVFRDYPASIVPCLLQIPIAIVIGLYLHRKGVNLALPSLLALAAMYLTVIFGDVGPLGAANRWLAEQSRLTWVIGLLLYSYVASVLPVWTLLQPRDYINSLQLISALGLVIAGLGVAALFGGAPSGDGLERPALEIVAPMWDFQPEEAPLIFPFLFVTIACGAISGFHCLVSSGTSSKQVDREPDARLIGYGSMLTEGFLATLVILACVAGLGLGSQPPGDEGVTLFGREAWDARYSSWTAASGLAAKVGAFVSGSANFVTSLGVPKGIAKALMGVLVASFAGTTLDTSCRLQRYVVQELATALLGTRRRLEAEPPERLFSPGRPPLSGNPLTWLTNKHGASLFAIAVAASLAAMPAPGQPMTWANAGGGGLILWPLFGATNQLLAGLAFIVIAFYLRRRGRPLWFLLGPAVFMLALPAWAMLYQIFIEAPGQSTSWIQDGNVVLLGIGLATVALEAWMVVEAARLWPKVRGVVEESAAPEPEPAMAGGVNC